MGNITPPFGYTLFTLQGVARNTTIQELYRASVPVIALYALVMVLLALFPDIILVLPSLM